MYNIHILVINTAWVLIVWVPRPFHWGRWSATCWVLFITTSTVVESQIETLKILSCFWASSHCGSLVSCPLVHESEPAKSCVIFGRAATAAAWWAAQWWVSFGSADNQTKCSGSLFIFSYIKISHSKWMFVTGHQCKREHKNENYVRQVKLKFLKLFLTLIFRNS